MSKAENLDAKELHEPARALLKGDWRGAASSLIGVAAAWSTANPFAGIVAKETAERLWAAAAARSATERLQAEASRLQLSDDETRRRQVEQWILHGFQTAVSDGSTASWTSHREAIDGIGATFEDGLGQVLRVLSLVSDTQAQITEHHASLAQGQQELKSAIDGLTSTVNDHSRRRQMPRGLWNGNSNEDSELTNLRKQEQELVLHGVDPSSVRRQIVARRHVLRSLDDVEPGALLYDGRFELKEHIGRGGFANVWKAFDHQTSTRVAIKMLHHQYRRDETWRERFFRGARRMAALDHRGVVKVALTQGLAEEVPYFVMEYVDGGDLQARVSKDGPWPYMRALALLASVCDALVHAHSRGRIHRDVKPANILLGNTDSIKLTDFDLVHAIDTTGGTRTNGLGTFLYAAPEQSEDASRVDERVDLYALGMVGLFLLRGNVTRSVLRDSKTVIEKLPCPESLHSILIKACSWDRDQRHRSAGELLRDLRNILSPKTVSHASLADRLLSANAKGTAEPRSRQWETERRQRKHPRGEVALPVRYHSPIADPAIHSRTRNLSSGGLFIESNSPPPAGTLLKLEFQGDAHSETVRAVARAVWVREREDELGPPGMGVKFVKLGPGGRETLATVLERLDSLA